MSADVGTGLESMLGGGAALGSASLSPLLFPLLLTMAPSLISRLFGGSAADRLRKQVQDLTSPQNISRLTNQYYQGVIGSPAYSQAQGTIAAGANQTSNDVAANLAARGIGTTGTGAVLSGLTPSLVGNQTAGLRTSAYNMAGQQAQDTISRQLAALTGTYNQPSMTQKLFGGGLSAFEPYLRAWLKQRYPGMFSNLSMNYGQQGQPGGMQVSQ